MPNNGLITLLWIFFLHCVGIYLFTSGFLLTRLSLSNSTTCPDGSCTLPPTHKRAVLLIIDALRFDFITPNPPEPVSPYHHGILSLPAELTQTRPLHSFIFNAYADPPTTTLQRIKGITTGTLPTFVDMGNNFGASSIEEDSIIHQVVMAGKKAAFMGDDTWMSVFPHSFESNMRFPYDSFNVEDLHTVDNGVTTHLLPLLKDPSKPFDFLVGHFLGVDHVGHRVGPDHPKMKEKLTQMNDVLKDVVDLLDDDTLLVVLGDHGMDRTGDHGGDGVLETSSAMWIYSKTHPLSLNPVDTPPPSGLLNYKTFPGTNIPWRAIQQIDLVPTLSLLLGLPIPFNNLGTVIPELFWRDTLGEHLHRALRYNSLQIKTYLDMYRDSPSGGELDESWANLQSAWDAVDDNSSHRLVQLSYYNQVALLACRSMWAQFNPLWMGLGLAIISVASIASILLYRVISTLGDVEWHGWLQVMLAGCIRSAAGGAVVGFLAFLSLENHVQGLGDPIDMVVFCAAIASSLWIVIVSSASIVNLKKIPSLFSIIPLALHSLSFFSNSFTFWEERVIQYLLITSIVPYVLTGIRAPTSRLRRRIVGYSLLFAVCTRLMAMSTVCREEQQPYCHVTFYAASSFAEPPWGILMMALPFTLALPWVVKKIMNISRSDAGAANIFIPFIFAPSLLGSTVFWFMEWAESKEDMFGGSASPLDFRFWRTWVARATMSWTVVLGTGLFIVTPLCIDIQVSKTKKQVTVLGFANSFGAPYLLFWSIPFALVYLSMQLTGQVVLGLSFIATLALLEVIDSSRDAAMMEELFATNPSNDPSTQRSWPLRFNDIIPFALMGLHIFYTTGHEATISSIQWKSAFIVTSTVEYPWAPMTVILNSFGPIFLFGVGAPMLAMWNRSPNVPPKEKSDKNNDKKVQNADLDAQVRKESLQASLGVMIYYGLLLLGAATSAALLRRHLMVWKVFAPRFMMAALSVLAVDVGVIWGNWVGVERVCGAIVNIFGKTK